MKNTLWDHLSVSHAFPIGVENLHDWESLLCNFGNIWFPLLKHIVVKWLSHHIGTVTSNNISVTMTYIIWHEEHLWNAIVFQKVHLSSLVISDSILHCHHAQIMLHWKCLFCYSRRRLEMEPEQQQNFCRNVQCIVEKDVVRTDRGNPYFAGEDNPNIDVMKWEIYFRVTVWIFVPCYQLLRRFNLKCKTWTENEI